MTLHFQKFGDTGSPLVLIHGLFGSAANWRSVARELSTEFQVYVLDLRNHGASKHLPSHTYLDLASDIQEFVLSQGLRDYFLCGHSMGGKAVMVNALMNDLLVDDQLRGVIVYDIAPVAYEHSHSNNLAALQALDLSTLSSRSDADKQLQAAIPDNATRLFLLQSLAKGDDGFYWKLNLPVLAEYMPDIVGFPNPLLTGKTCSKPALFLYGEASGFVQATAKPGILAYFPNAIIEPLAGAGHWVHVDNRSGLIEASKRFIQQIVA